MKKNAICAISMYLALAVGSVYAADNMSQDGMAKSSMPRDSMMSQDAMTKSSMPKDSMMKKDTAPHDGMKK